MNRRIVAGLCLIASAVLHLASNFLWPAGSEGSAAVQVAAAHAHPGAMAGAALVEAAGWALLLPALVVLWHEVRGRGAALVGIGVWTAVVGVLAFFAAGALNLVTIDLGGLSNGAVAFDAVRHDGRLVALVVLPISLGLVGQVVLLAGLARAGLGHWWMPVAGVVSVVANQMLPQGQNALLLSATFLPIAAALVTVGVRLMTTRPAAVPAAVSVPA